MSVLELLPGRMVGSSTAGVAQLVCVRLLHWHNNNFVNMFGGLNLHELHSVKAGAGGGEAQGHEEEGGEQHGGVVWGGER